MFIFFFFVLNSNNVTRTLQTHVTRGACIYSTRAPITHIYVYPSRYRRDEGLMSVGSCGKPPSSSSGCIIVCTRRTCSLLYTHAAPFTRLRIFSRGFADETSEKRIFTCTVVRRRRRRVTRRKTYVDTAIRYRITARVLSTAENKSSYNTRGLYRRATNKWPRHQFITSGSR